jgi:hypothetical protein
MNINGCTVKELRERLAQLPDDMVVRVLKECHGGYETYTKMVPLKLPEQIDGCTDTFDTCGGKLYLGEQ